MWDKLEIMDSLIPSRIIRCLICRRRAKPKRPMRLAFFSFFLVVEVIGVVVHVVVVVVVVVLVVPTTDAVGAARRLTISTLELSNKRKSAMPAAVRQLPSWSYHSPKADTFGTRAKGWANSRLKVTDVMATLPSRPTRHSPCFAFQAYPGAHPSYAQWSSPSSMQSSQLPAPALTQESQESAHGRHSPTRSWGISDTAAVQADLGKKRSQSFGGSRSRGRTSP
mmetsp:Transcript_46979/g.102178  ORF Transcript_46979/g.102178 Transcript_46979/m.102178 type:complete len:223 (-) Transcript_46979:196-864(-)